MNLVKGLFLGLSLVGVSGAFAMTSLDEIASVKVVSCQERPEVCNSAPSTTPEDKGLTVGDLGEIAAIADGIMAIGKKVWPLVVAGQAVLDTENRPISVLPYQNQENPRSTLDSMWGWETPKAENYQITFSNLLGGTIAQFEYSVRYQPGGTDGAGKYLTSVDIVPTKVYAQWGIVVNASSSLVSISNSGTKENPVASAVVQLDLDVTQKFYLNRIHYKINYYVGGDGEFKALNWPF